VDYGGSRGSRSLYVVARPSVVCLSVTSVRPTQTIEIFGTFLRNWYLSHPFDNQAKFYGDRPRGTHSLGGLKGRGVAKYSDFGPFESYISKTVQDMM